jgi:hypothetical protein
MELANEVCMSSPTVDLYALADHINRSIPLIKRGAFRFWGVWFGRPFDNVHMIVGAEAQIDTLRLSFAAGEVLLLSNPEGIRIDADEFIVLKASRIRWTWYPGVARDTPQSMEYVFDGRTVTKNTDVHWCQESPPPDVNAPAVEML